MLKKAFLLLLVLFLFISCLSINSTRNNLGKVVIFSFDDGPDEHTTPLLLDVLKRHEIKAMFFLLGVNAEQFPDIVKRMHEEGHIIVNHGYYDKQAGLMKDEEFTENLLLGEEAISSALGIDFYPRLYRPHGGYYTQQHERILIDRGYSIVSANIRVYDAVKTSASRRQIVKQIVRNVIRTGGGIILLHDARGIFSRKEIEIKKNPDGPFNRLWIVDVVDEVIVSLLDKGFTLHHPDLLAAAGF